MKPLEEYNKLRGGYYTPDRISRFVTEWAVRSPSDTVLEPSCGDGSFLCAISAKLTELGASAEQIRQNVTGVELDCNEARKSKKYGTTVVCEDFFTYYEGSIDDKIKFDLILPTPIFDEKIR